jgi:hypothetical protein
MATVNVSRLYQNMNIIENIHMRNVSEITDFIDSQHLCAVICCPGSGSGSVSTVF